MKLFPEPVVKLGREKTAGSRRTEPCVLRSVADLYESIGFIARQGSQKYRIHDGKHSCVGANPKRQCDYSGHCECWTTSQPSASNEQVRDHGLVRLVIAILRPVRHLGHLLPVHRTGSVRVHIRTKTTSRESSNAFRNTAARTKSSINVLHGSRVAGLYFRQGYGL
jgi:hypothetical protein